jgi:hypothetical protein
VPLLRAGFRPDGLYKVSYVYVHAGAPFLKKGDMQMTLPRMDVPVSVVEWELFVPDRFRADRFGGNAIDASLLADPVMVDRVAYGAGGRGGGIGSGVGIGVGGGARLPRAQSGQINGRVVDASGAAMPGVTIVVEGSGQRQTVISDANGVYVAANLPSGPVTVTGQLPGFKTTRRSLRFDQRPQQVDIVLQIGGIEETVTVSADSAAVVRNEPARQVAQAAAPSANVQNLQRRASGVLPVRMDVPRAGTSHRFVKPLVIDEETLVTFRYKRR